MDEGRLVMSPSVQMTAEGPVQLSIGNKDDGYTLELDIVEHSGSAAADAAAMQVVLWRGPIGSGSRLLDRVILLTPGGDAGAVGAGSDRQQTTGTSVELISHALQSTAIGDLVMLQAIPNE